MASHIVNNSFFTNTTIMWALNLALGLYIVFYGRNKPRSTIIWILVLSVLPIIGFLFYLMFGQNKRRTKKFYLKQEDDTVLEKLALKQFNAIDDYDFLTKNKDADDYEPLVKMNLKSDEAFLTEDNEIDLFFDGKDKFDSLLKDLTNAKVCIDMEYYIFRHDEIGKKIIAILEQKAKEGVKVRFLYDVFGGRFLKKKYFKQLRENGGEIGEFLSSVFKVINPRINYRNHRKIVVIDNKIGYIGGFNVGDEYLGKNRHFGKWRDTHARVVGSAVLGLKLRFIKDWFYTVGTKPDLSKELDFDLNFSGDIAAQVLTSGPDSEFKNIRNSMIHMISLAKREVYIQTPYLVPDDSMLDTIKMAIIRGVEVNIMLPKKPDHVVVHWVSMSFARELCRLGANIYLYKEGFLHSKVVIIDDFVCTLGSVNIDERSFALNFEANLVIYDEGIVRTLKEAFSRDVEVSMLLSKHYFENRSVWVRARETIMRLFSPLM